jgi:hypothetical protein
MATLVLDAIHTIYAIIDTYAIYEFNKKYAIRTISPIFFP